MIIRTAFTEMQPRTTNNSVKPQYALAVREKKTYDSLQAVIKINQRTLCFYSDDGSQLELCLVVFLLLEKESHFHKLEVQ